MYPAPRSAPASAQARRDALRQLLQIGLIGGGAGLAGRSMLEGVRWLKGEPELATSQVGPIRPSLPVSLPHPEEEKLAFQLPQVGNSPIGVPGLKNWLNRPGGMLGPPADGVERGPAVRVTQPIGRVANVEGVKWPDGSSGMAQGRGWTEGQARNNLLYAEPNSLGFQPQSTPVRADAPDFDITRTAHAATGELRLAPVPGAEQIETDVTFPGGHFEFNPANIYADQLGRTQVPPELMPKFQSNVLARLQRENPENAAAYQEWNPGVKPTPMLSDPRYAKPAATPKPAAAPKLTTPKPPVTPAAPAVGLTKANAARAFGEKLAEYAGVNTGPYSGMQAGRVRMLDRLGAANEVIEGRPSNGWSDLRAGSGGPLAPVIIPRNKRRNADLGKDYTSFARQTALDAASSAASDSPAFNMFVDEFIGSAMADPRAPQMARDAHEAVNAPHNTISQEDRAELSPNDEADIAEGLKRDDYWDSSLWASANVKGLDDQIAAYNRQRKEHPFHYLLNPFTGGPVTDLLNRAARRYSAGSVGSTAGTLIPPYGMYRGGAKMRELARRLYDQRIAPAESKVLDQEQAVVDKREAGKKPSEQKQPEKKEPEQEERQKAAVAQQGPPKDMLQGFANALIPTPTTSQPLRDWWGPAAAFGSAGAGIAGGWTLADWLFDKQRNMARTDELEDAEANYRAALAESYQKAMQAKHAGDDLGIDDLFDALEGHEKVAFNPLDAAELPYRAALGHDNVQFGKGLLLASMLAAGTGAGFATYNMAQQTDKKKILQKALKQRAARRATATPAPLLAFNA